jgi:hypothetical protein
MGGKENHTTHFDGIRTLNLYLLRGQMTQDVGPFESGNLRIEYPDPTYLPRKYSASKVSEDASVAKFMVRDWQTHFMDFVYYVQFRDDFSRKLIKALSEHTQLVSDLCDARLKIDTASLWDAFDSIHGFESVHGKYRADAERESNYGTYSDQLEKAYARLGGLIGPCQRLIQRMERQIERDASLWKELPSVKPISKEVSVGPLRLFYCYSHADELLRTELQKYLSVLRRNKVISDWSDRRISGGTEWEGAIDENLKNAQIILLLISADFLNSDYCWDVEMKHAMLMHEWCLLYFESARGKGLHLESSRRFHNSGSPSTNGTRQKQHSRT